MVKVVVGQGDATLSGLHLELVVIVINRLPLGQSQYFARELVVHGRGCGWGEQQ